MKALTVLILAAAHFTAHAQSAWQILNEGFDPASRLVLEKPFNFFESCEMMPGKVLGRDPVSRKIRPITVEIYRPREGAIDKRVLVVPPTGGVNHLDREYSRQLCGRGIEAWVITEWEPGQVDHRHSLHVQSHDIVARKALAAVRQVAGRMKQPVGILGTSAGAIVASVALAVEPRLTAGVLIAGGSGMAEIIARSNGEVMQNLRQARLSRFGWTQAQYQAELARHIRLDVEDFAEGFEGKRIGTIIALRDRTVPVNNQLRLEAITGAQRIAAIDDDHVAAIVQGYLWNSPRVVSFFERYL